MDKMNLKDNNVKESNINEKWSDDPSNDDWKRNPDGTFMKDLAGNKIPIDELEDLKKKLAELPAKIKSKILSFLSGTTNTKPAFAESTKVTMTFGQLKKLIKEAKTQRFRDLPESDRIQFIRDFWEEVNNGADYHSNIYGFCKYLGDAGYENLDTYGYTSRMFDYDTKRSWDLALTGE